MQVLLVEDDFRLADALRRGLEEEGHPVAVASDGVGGLRCALQQTFDVIVLDVLLPAMDGFTVSRKLREKLKPDAHSHADGPGRGVRCHLWAGPRS